MKARIIKLISNKYRLLLEDGQEVDAIPSGLLRLDRQVKCGDFVEYSFKEDHYIIDKILERNNELVRPPIANVDQALVVMSAKEPEFSLNLVDQILIMAHHNQIDPVIIVTKMDLIHDEKQFNQIIDQYRDAGNTVILTGINSPTKELEKILSNKVSVLMGQSGVGKSSLLNRINPDFDIKTQEISSSLGRGKHTTRHVELIKVGNGWVADTPGFSKIDVTLLTEEELRDSMADFKAIEGSCRFRDCYHVNEPGCKVIAAVKNEEFSNVRYQNYLRYYQEISNTRRKY